MAILLSTLLFCIAFIMQQQVPHVLTAPVAPNISSCHLPAMGFPKAEPLFDCCAPAAASYSASSVRLFRPSSSSSSSLRVRRPSHTASPEYAAKLARAYTLMKALPADDPRSFAQQANIHCAYCNAVYNQIDSTQLFQVHGSWLFSPFHRWYLYFHERILVKLLDDDDTFALTFWNYDNHNSTSIPWLYNSYNDTLVSFVRDTQNVDPNATVSIDNPVPEGRTQEEQLTENDYAMYRTLIRDASTTEEFLGSAYRQGDLPMPGGGTLELTPHNHVHLWVGNKSAVGLKDMGSFYAAARDPLFYAHHAQLDRLWETWKNLSYREQIEEEDYLNSEFFFYNEDAELVRVRVGDALDTTLLGYIYEEVETPWVDIVLPKLSSGPAELAADDSICEEGEAILSPCSIVLEATAQEGRSTGSRSPWLHQQLVLTVEVDPGNLGAHIDIYVNLPSANASTGSGVAEYVYGLNTLTVSAMSPDESVNTTTRLNLYGRLVDLNLAEESSIIMTLVPPVRPSMVLSLISYSLEYSSPFQFVTSKTSHMPMGSVITPVRNLPSQLRKIY